MFDEELGAEALQCLLDALVGASWSTSSSTDEEAGTKTRPLWSTSPSRSHQSLP